MSQMFTDKYEEMDKIKPDYNINDLKDPKKYCELCGSILDHHEIIKNYKPIDIIKKMIELSIQFPKSFQILSITIRNPGLSYREYSKILGVSYNAIYLGIQRLEKHFAMKLYCPKFISSPAQKRRRRRERGK